MLKHSVTPTNNAAIAQQPATVLLLGGSGQIGRCLLAEIQQQWPNATLLSPSRAQLDLSDLTAVRAYLQQHQPDWLLNCAAYTQVDAAEQDPHYAPATSHATNPATDNHVYSRSATSCHPNTALNAQLPQLLADYWRMSPKPITLLHFSSDYVYSGQGEMPWREDAEPAPVNAYGHAKASGDAALLAALSEHAAVNAVAQSTAAQSTAALGFAAQSHAGQSHTAHRHAAALPPAKSRLYLLRTSWVYHQQGHNFINSMLRLAAQRDVLRVVDDQFGAPTPAEWAAQVSRLLLQSEAANGLYHLAPSGVTSWYGVAYAALSSAVSAGVLAQVPELIAISSDQYPTAAKRPHNSRLDCHKLQQALALEFPDWQVLLRQQMQRR